MIGLVGGCLVRAGIAVGRLVLAEGQPIREFFFGQVVCGQYLTCLRWRPEGVHEHCCNF